MGKYFPQQYFIPEYPGKDQNYYETILCETYSAQIFHTRNGEELGFYQNDNPENSISRRMG